MIAKTNNGGEQATAKAKARANTEILAAPE
jgi:hypothetical protein